MRVGVLIVACGWLAASGTREVPAATLGEQVFSDPKLSTSPINAFSCATCHQVGAASGRINPGFNLAGTVTRGGWWGGYETGLLDSINYCLTEFMGGARLAATDPRARELYEYLAASGDPQPPGVLPLTIVKTATGLTDLTGVAATGQQLYDASCVRCHGAPHTGDGRISSRASIVPEDSLAVFPTQARAVVVEKIRHGKFFNIGGFMPPYPAEALTDQQVADILAYLGL